MSIIFGLVITMAVGSSAGDWLSYLPRFSDLSDTVVDDMET